MKELTPEEKKAEVAKQEAADRALLAKKAHVPVEEIKPTPEEEFNGKANKLVKDIFVALNHADYAQVQVLKNVITEALDAAYQVNYETDLLADYDPFGRQTPV